MYNFILYKEYANITEAYDLLLQPFEIPLEKKHKVG